MSLTSKARHGCCSKPRQPAIPARRRRSTARPASSRRYPAPRDGTTRVDVAIVGGGITGLWTAYHLATQGRAGRGPRAAPDRSWRVGPRLRPARPLSEAQPSEDRRRLRRRPRRAAVAGGRGGTGGDFGVPRRAPDRLRGHANRPPVRRAHRRRTAPARGDGGRAADARRRRCSTATTPRHIVGSDLYPAVLLDPRGFHLDPLAYARGLARVAGAQGAFIYPQTPVDSIAPHEFALGAALRRRGG